jgi:hypothetical protein
MPKTHNKKRNIGIIYEQIIQHVCKKAMENNEVDAEQGIGIIKECFRKGTQLNKEYKLFKALAETNGVSGHLANSIIFEAKKACNQMFDSEKLEKEKSSLIKKLNYNFGKGVIFEENIENYKLYATIQTLLNEWRDPKNASFDLTTKYEIKLHESLTADNIKDVKPKNSIKADRLTFKLMNEIFDKKYKSILNESQNKLLYYFSSNKEEDLDNACNSLKNDTQCLLEEYMESCNNKILLEKYRSINSQINELSTEQIDKKSLQKYLLLAKLREELLGEE